MANIEIKNLTMIFGNKKQVLSAQQMIKDHADVKTIREETGATLALKDINLSIKDSELFVIVGLSGSGKSTLIRCINRLNEPTEGEIYIDGENILDYDKDQLRQFRRKRISMVFQHFGLLSHRSILKNVEYGLEVQGVDKVLRKQKAMETIEVVGLSGWENMKPHQLSGGMKQRVGLARAIVTEPDILLMDEPYSALDPLIRREMQNELLTLEDYINRTIVFITHDMNEAFKMGDRIALMKDGEIVQMGPPQDFFNQPANDYVKDFIADVDKTQIIKVRNIMHSVEHVVAIDTPRKDLIKTMQKQKFECCYVVDERSMYLGLIKLDALQKADGDEIQALVEPFEPIRRNTYIKELWDRFDTHVDELPVVNTKGKFYGAISKDDIFKMLS